MGGVRLALGLCVMLCVTLGWDFNLVVSFSKRTRNEEDVKALRATKHNGLPVLERVPLMAWKDEVGPALRIESPLADQQNEREEEEEEDEEGMVKTFNKAEALYLKDWGTEKIRTLETLSTWETHVLSEPKPVSVYSFTKRDRADRKVCRDKDKRRFTVVMSVNGPFSVGGANAQIVQLVNFLLDKVGPEYIRGVVLSWNPGPSDDTTGALDALGHLIQSPIPVELVLHNSNKLENRFAFGDYLCSEHVLHLDDDVLIPPPLMIAGYGLFRDYFSDRLLGYYCAEYSKNHHKDMMPGDYMYLSKGLKADYNCNMVLTGLVFLNAKYHNEYHRAKYAAIRQDVVEKYLSGEDILMNFVVGDVLKRNSKRYGHTDKAHRYPTPINFPRSRALTGPRFAPKNRTLDIGSAVRFGQHQCFFEDQIGRISIRIGHTTRPTKTLWSRPPLQIDGEEWPRRTYVLNQIVKNVGPVAKKSMDDNVCNPNVHINK